MASIEEDNAAHVLRFTNAPPHPSYIAGIIDGDGCIFIRKLLNGYQSGITLTQSRTNVLHVIRYHFGGSITTSANRNDRVENTMTEDKLYHKHNRRNQYNLTIRSNEYSVLLDYIRGHIIIKYQQIEYLYDFYKLADIPNVIDDKEALYKKCTEQNLNKTMNEISLPRLNNEYIQGLFDAEGCFYIDKTLSNDVAITIAQQNNPIILEKIKELLGYGKVYCNKKYTIQKKSDCLKFIALVKNGLIVKYNQAIAFEKYLLTDNMTVKAEMYKICNEEKHKIEHFTDVNCNDAGKEGYNKTMQLREVARQEAQRLHLKQVYKEKSEKMMGENNHNFGKPMSEETKKKQSLTMRELTNSISDEAILQVRALILDGKKNTEIEELLQIQKHIISRVKNGLTVCRTEVKAEKIAPLTQEEQNIRRRKIRLDELFIVVDKVFAEVTPKSILDSLSAVRVKEKITNNLTVDIIKNIKRNMVDGKLPFYKSEVPLEKYEHYQSELLKFCASL